jgi:hypothetical protein
MSFDPAGDLMRGRLLDAPPRPGLLGGLDRFEVIRLLGVGGMGMVFLARDPQRVHQDGDSGGGGNSGGVAIKVVKPELAHEPRAVHRFLKEAQHMERLEHSNILRVLEKRDRPEGAYFVLPYVEGGSLARLIEPGRPMETQAVRRIALQMAQALQYAHEQGITHRDLKPANVLVERDGHAYLADFGLGRTFFNDSVIDVRRSQCEGTAPYMSPAVARGEAEDTRCDIYAFGALMYEMLTGDRPYDGETSAAIIAKVLDGPPTPIEERNPEADGELTKIAQWCMARELRERYASMADVAADLQRAESGEKALGPHRGEHAKEGWGAASARLKRWRWWASIAAAGVLVAIIISMAWSYTNISGHITTQSIPSSGNGITAAGLGFTAVDTLLDDVFTKPTVDESKWAWGQTAGQTYQGTGKRRHQVTQGNGSLLLEAQAEHERGWSASQAVWLDLLLDLSQQSHTVIEVEYSLTAINGGLSITLSESKPPASTAAEGAVLLRRQGNKNHPLNTGRRRMVIHIARDSNLATIFTDAPGDTGAPAPGDTGAPAPGDPGDPGSGGTSGQVQLVDLTNPAQHRLRFQIEAVSTAGFPPDTVRLFLNHVRVLKVEEPTTIAGRVVNTMSRHPVATAKVTATIGDREVTTTTGEDGVYRLIGVSGQAQLIAKANDYAMAAGPMSLRIEPGHFLRTDLMMRKTQLSPGDVMAAVPYTHAAIEGIAAKPPWLYFVTADGNERSLHRMESNGLSPQRIGPTSPVNGLCWRDSELLAVAWWPGRLYRIDPQTGAMELIARLPMDWPVGLAWDGQTLWCLEADHPNNRFGLVALTNDGKVARNFAIADTGITGLAFGAGRLWITSHSGYTYCVDPARLQDGSAVESAVIARLPGSYGPATFADDVLATVDQATKQVCFLLTGK